MCYSVFCNSLLRRCSPAWLSAPLILAACMLALVPQRADAVYKAALIHGRPDLGTFAANNGQAVALDSQGCEFLGKTDSWAEFDSGDNWENNPWLGTLWELWIEDASFDLGSPSGWGFSSTFFVTGQLLGGAPGDCSWAVNVWVYDWTGKQFDVLTFFYTPPNALTANYLFDDNNLVASNPGGTTGAWILMNYPETPMAAFTGSTSLGWMLSLDFGYLESSDPITYDKGLTVHKVGFTVWNTLTPRTTTDDDEPGTGGEKAEDIVLDDRMCKPNGTHPWEDCGWAITGPTGNPGYSHVVVN